MRWFNRKKPSPPDLVPPGRDHLGSERADWDAAHTTVAGALPVALGAFLALAENDPALDNTAYEMLAPLDHRESLAALLGLSVLVQEALGELDEYERDKVLAFMRHTAIALAAHSCADPLPPSPRAAQ